MRDDGVGAGGAQIVGGETFQDFVGQAVGRRQRQLQGLGIGDAGAIEVGRLNFCFSGQRLDLRRRAMNEHHPDVQRAQHRDIQQDFGEVLVGDDRAIDC